MEYRRVGASGLKVSAISVGGWITFGGTIEDEIAGQILRTSIEGGVNFVDLADVYAMGEAEKTVGRFLPEYTRSELVISSKVFGKMSDDPNDRGLSRKHIFESVDRSLRNLGTDYLDIYYCHRSDPETPLAETAAAMDDLVHQGKILYWGTSVWSPDSLEAAHTLADDRRLYAPIVEQPLYNLTDRGIEKDVIPTAKRLGMGLTVWSPLAGGLLTGKYADGIPKGSRAETSQWLDAEKIEANRSRLARFSEIAAGMGAQPGQLALAWILQNDAISCVLTGATTPAHVESNLKAIELEISGDVNAELGELFPA
jgi:voltage-dependent potassium channel beta subunit